MKNKGIVVSINCITYNHEKYIGKAIESFLMQKTNFSFEILIHDDASTDKTQEIIKKYQDMYPEVIKPIFQKENQYSKGIKRIGHLFNEKRAVGKYIALCEGDDYWIDPYKLQKQVDYMESNEKCSMCFHAADILDEKKNKIINVQRAYNENRIASIEDIILKGGGFCPTASILYRKKLIEDLPEFYIKAHVGDYPIQMIMASKGDVYYIDKSMSVYRINVNGSWTNREVNGDNFNKKIVENNKKDINLLNEFDKYTKNIYSSILQRKILECEFNIDVISKNIKTIKSNKYSKIYKDLSVQKKIKIYFRNYFPQLYLKICKVKRKYKQIL